MNEYPFFLGLLNPDSLAGAIFYAVLFSALTIIAAVIIRRFTQRIITRTEKSSVDRTATARQAIRRRSMATAALQPVLPGVSADSAMVAQRDYRGPRCIQT